MFEARPPAAVLLTFTAALWFAVLIMTVLSIRFPTATFVGLDAIVIVIALAATAVWIHIVRPPFHLRRDLRLSPNWFAGFLDEGPDQPLDPER